MPPCASGSSRMFEALELATGEGATSTLALAQEVSGWCSISIALGFFSKLYWYEAPTPHEDSFRFPLLFLVRLADLLRSDTVRKASTSISNEPPCFFWMLSINVATIYIMPSTTVQMYSLLE